MAGPDTSRAHAAPHTQPSFHVVIITCFPPRCFSPPYPQPKLTIYTRHPLYLSSNPPNPSPFVRPPFRSPLFRREALAPFQPPHHAASALAQC